VIKSIKYKGGATNVLYREGKARPYQIMVRPESDLDAPARFVSLKTEKAVIQRLNSQYEAIQEEFVARYRHHNIK